MCIATPQAFAWSKEEIRELDALFSVSDYITLNHKYTIGVGVVDPKIPLSKGIWDCTTRAMAIKQFAEMVNIEEVELKHGYYNESGRLYKHDWAEYKGVVLEGSGSTTNYIQVGEGVWV